MGQLLQTTQFLSEVWGACSPRNYFTWNEAGSNLITENVLKHLKNEVLVKTHTNTHTTTFSHVYENGNFPTVHAGCEE